MAVVHTRYYTDPACPWSWALEPALARLLHEFDDGLRFTYVMCGIARDFGDLQQVVGEMLNASDASGMPVDPRLWLESPPRSSHPACIAVKAAAEQGAQVPYLRRLREGLMCRRRKLDGGEALTQEALSVEGIALGRFRIDLASHATLEAFSEDLERARSVPAEHHAPGSDRVKLPSLEFRGEDEEVHGVYGYCEYSALRQAAVAAGAEPRDATAPSIEDALARFGSMATSEVAAVCQLPGPRAPAELWRLATEWRVRPERLGSAELWSLGS